MSVFKTAPVLLPKTSNVTSLSPAELILPYTQGLTGVNLWLNNVTGYTLLGFLSLLVFLVLFFRALHIASDYIRLITTINLDENQQTYWTQDTGWSWLKKHLLSAPLFRKRHNRELQISKATGCGTIPSRLHTIFLSLYFLSNVVYCLLLDYHNQPRAALLAEIRGRTAHLAVINMLPLFLFAARNNPFIAVLGITFDTFNLFHRWIGRIVVIEGIAHAFIWGVNKYDAIGLDGIHDSLRTDRFLQYGLMTSIAMTLMLIQSPSPVRHAFYEIFLHLHQFLAAAAFVGILLHVESQKLPQKPFLYFLIALWVSERALRLLRVVYYNISRRGIAEVHITALDGGACRVTFNIRRSWTTTPGCHIFAYIPSISLHMSHPFSVAWYESGISDLCNERPLSNTSNTSAAMSSSSTLNNTDTEADFKPLPRRNGTAVSCIIAARSGMTAKLYRRARASPTNTITLRAFLEGPYGGVRSLRSYGTVLLFAGGVGITHQLSHLCDLITASTQSLSSTRKIVLVWSVRSVEQLSWARPWLQELVERGRDEKRLLKLLFYVSSPPKETGGDADGPSAVCGAQIRSGRANILDIVEREAEQRVGAMTIGVCGPGAFADDVRAAARGVMGRGKNVDFWEEAFTW